jgi:Ca-activated chloride channel homolog
MMKFDADDPRLTAFALGELDAEEARPIERALAESPSLQREIDQIRAMAGSLQSRLKAEISPRLTPAQREMIAQEPKSVLNSPLIFGRGPRWIAAGAALAACIALAITAAIMFNNQVDTNNTVAIEQHAQTKANEEKSRLERPADKLSDRRDAQSQFETVPGRVGADGSLRDETRSQPRETASGEAGLAKNQEPPVAASVAENDRRSSARSQPRARPRSDVPPPAARPSSPPAPTSAGGMRDTSAKEVQAAPGMGDGGFASRAVDEDDLGGDPVRFGNPAPPGANEGLEYIEDNPFKRAIDEPLSTFSIDVDTASYSNVRRFINQGMLPPRDAVRIEELVNYFNYSYEPPTAADNNAPFSANVEVNTAPWNQEHKLVRIGLKGKEVKLDMRAPTSLVFLIDVSGSMSDSNKLPLVKQSLKLLIDQLNGDDRLAIVTYAGQAGLVLDSIYVTGENKPRIIDAIDNLSAGGSTNGAGGIGVAYDTAVKHFIKGGVNRVILCTDGDFNVGVASNSDLVQLVQERRTSGVFLSVLGFGQGNLKEDKMQELAKHGNGNFAYIDSIDEGRKVLVEQMGGTLITIAKDVKIQVDFNPKKVGSYRLIGFENRMLAAQDFRDDKKDAGEIGSGHTMTALYEITAPSDDRKADDVAQSAPQSDFVAPAQIVESDLLLKLKVSYKQPEGDQSTELVFPIADEGVVVWDRASSDFKFASAVAAFGMVLRDSPYKGEANLPSVLAWAREANASREANAMMDKSKLEQSEDQPDYRAEFIELVERAQAMPRPE